ncbi:MAG TPA: FkbM family methyltransferase [Vicinamibacterales bacterium]|nr:FkbM family methyltransferase [Vicinamibacterales bacterium]
MNRHLSSWGKRLARTAGLSVHRARPENRFEAMSESLEMMKQRGYAPRVVIDGGANLGQWATLASAVFPQAVFNLIEPQPRCQEHLRASLTAPRFRVHPFALTAPGVHQVRLASAGGQGVSTGAFVTDREWGADVDVLEAPATTLDELLADSVTAADRVLLKLDLEGHELAALQGATTLLGIAEALVIETSFYDIFSQGRPLFAEIVAHLTRAGFVLYDFAALYPRARDQRLRMADAILVRTGSPLLDDVSWD